MKWLNTLPFHGSIHGSESHTGHHFFIADVVQRLVYGLAKARMPVRFRSLAPFDFNHILICGFFKIVIMIIKFEKIIEL